MGFDHPLYPQYKLRFVRIIGLDCRGLLDGPPIPFGIHFELNFSFPTRGNMPIKAGYGTPSTRSYAYNLELLLTLVIYLEAMCYYISFFNLFEYEFLLVNFRLWSGKFLAKAGIA